MRHWSSWPAVEFQNVATVAITWRRDVIRTTPWRHAGPWIASASYAAGRRCRHRRSSGRTARSTPDRTTTSVVVGIARRQAPPRSRWARPGRADTSPDHGCGTCIRRARRAKERWRRRPTTRRSYRRGRPVGCWSTRPPTARRRPRPCPDHRPPSRRYRPSRCPSACWRRRAVQATVGWRTSSAACGWRTDWTAWTTAVATTSRSNGGRQRRCVAAESRQLHRTSRRRSPRRRHHHDSALVGRRRPPRWHNNQPVNAPALPLPTS